MLGVHRFGGHKVYDGCDGCRERARQQARRWRGAHPEYTLEYSRRNQEKNSVRNRRLKDQKREFAQEVLGTMCIDCSEDRVLALEFHHPNGDGKRDRSIFALGWAEFKEELMKVVPVCGTCHNIRHGGR